MATFIVRWPAAARLQEAPMTAASNIAAPEVEEPLLSLTAESLCL